MNLLSLLCFTFAFWVPSIAHSTVIDSKDFGTVQTVLENLRKTIPSKKILVVFDNDNTLLQMDSDLGSDQWFQWQSAIVNQDDPKKVADDFAGLLRAQGILFQLGTMSPPGGPLQVQVAMAIAAQFPTMVLTARSCNYDPGKEYSFLDATHRELTRNGYRFENSAPEPNEGYPSPFTPYTANDIQKMGLTEAERKLFEVTPTPRNVCYSSGIYMTSGQHKGLMLRALLHKASLSRHYRTIVVVDDKEKYCKQFEDAFAGKIPVRCIRYGATDDRVKAFQASDKSAVNQSWSVIKGTLEKALPSGWK